MPTCGSPIPTPVDIPSQGLTPALPTPREGPPAPEESRELRRERRRQWWVMWWWVIALGLITSLACLLLGFLLGWRFRP